MELLRDHTRHLESTLAAETWREWARSLALAGDGHTALDLLEGRVGRDRAAPYRKAAVTAGSGSTDPNLVEARLGTAFVDSYRSRRLLPQLPGKTSVPPSVLVPIGVTDVVAGFVTEGGPIPCVPLAYNRAMLQYAKIGIIVPISNELARLGATSSFNNDLVQSLSEGENDILLGTQAATEFGEPEGMLHNIGATGGGSPATLMGDMYAVWTGVRDGNPLAPAWTVSPRGAAYLASLNVEGTPLFPDISPATGGTIWKVPVILSRSAGNRLILMDGASVVYTDGGLTIERSRQASIQQDSAPGSGAQQLVSLWQANATALLAVRYISWTFAHGDRAAYLELPIDNSPA